MGTFPIESPSSTSSSHPAPPTFSSVYLPLAPNHTRFLTIYPASRLEDDICCELKPVCLDDIARYEALSYTWGSGELSCTASVNGCSLPITANLSDALRYLREADQPRTIWADAICINQSDLEERSSQVAFMGKIYSTVRLVVIWLGREIEGGDPGLRRLADGPSLWNWEDSEIRSATGTLFERDWWSRCWIIQEFFNSTDQIFVCGYITLSGGTVHRIFHAFYTSNRIIDVDHDYSHFFTFAKRQSDELKHLMLDWGHTEATDPRDKVYAFLGLAKDLDTIIPDYNALPRDVYTDLVRRYVEEDGNLEIICTHHRGRNSLTLPSWVPDWSISRPGVHNWTIHTNYDPFFAAGYVNIKRSIFGRTLPSVDKDISTWRRRRRKITSVKRISFEDGGALRVRGVFIGCISDIGDEIEPPSFNMDGLKNAIRKWAPPEVKSGTYHTGESNLRSFSRTLVTDHHERARYNESNIYKLERNIRNILSDTSADIDPAEAHPLRRPTYTSRFAILDSGHFAMVPLAAEVGEEVWILHGASVPMVLKGQQPPHLEIRTRQMVGPSYVHGVMDGEMASDESDEWDSLRII